MRQALGVEGWKGSESASSEPFGVASKAKAKMNS